MVSLCCYEREIDCSPLRRKHHLVVYYSTDKDRQCVHNKQPLLALNVCMIRYGMTIHTEVTRFHFPSTSRLYTSVCPLTRAHSPTQRSVNTGIHIHTRPLFSLFAVRPIGQRQIELKVYFSAVARGEESAIVGGKQFNHGKTLCVCVCFCESVYLRISIV